MNREKGSESNAADAASGQLNGARDSQEEINRLRVELRGKDSILDISLELASKLFLTSDEEAICRIMAMATSGTLGVQKVSAYTCRPGSDSYALGHELGSWEEHPPEVIRAARRFIKWLEQRPLPAHIDSYYNSGTIGEAEAGWCEELVRTGYSNLFPLSYEDGARGLIFMSGKVSGRKFTSYDRDFIRTLSAIGSLALARAGENESGAGDISDMLDFYFFKEEDLARRSFELNTPLTVLKSTLWSVEGGMAGEGLMIDMAKDAVTDLQQKIAELANFAELKYEETELNLNMTDISAILDDSLRKFIPEIEQKFAEVDYNEKVHREIHADPGKMELALNALVGQLVDAAAQGGRITLSTTVTASQPVDEAGIELPAFGSAESSEREERSDKLERELSVIEGGSWFVVTAAAGIESGQFEPDKVIESHSLRIVRKVVSDHGGRVFFEQGDNGRLRVSLFLPASV